MSVLSAAIFLSVFRMVVIPVQFQDRSFVTPEADLSEVVSASQDYFNEQFDGSVRFVFEMSPVVTLSENVSYYGSNYSDRRDVLLHRAVREACRSLSSGIDFSRYDNDADGVVDNVFLITAGMSENEGAGAEWIWPQHAFLSGNGGTEQVGSVLVDGFSVCTEFTSSEQFRSGSGIFCHEFGHVLGLVDLYDTDGDGSGGRSNGLFNTVLMDDGCKRGDGNDPPCFSAVDLEMLSLGKCGTLSKGHHNLPPVETSRRYLKAVADREGEFFLFECRGGKGLVAYHIDMSSSDAGYSDYYKKNLTAAERWEYSQVNCRPDRQCAYIMADSSRGLDGIYFRDGSFGSDTSPSFRYWSGATSRLAITGIRLEDDGSVSFDVVEPIVLTSTTVFQDAAIVGWSVAEELGGITSFDVLWTDGITERSMTLPSGAVSCTVEGLSPQTLYRITVRANSADGGAFSANTTVATKIRRDDSYPYIYLSGSERTPDGRFVLGSRIPLRVFNLTEVLEVRWYFDGERISADADGFYTITRAGQLKAEVLHDDGSREVIVKEICL